MKALLAGVGASFALMWFLGAIGVGNFHVYYGAATIQCVRGGQ
jgi:hypothetical protein